MIPPTRISRGRFSLRAAAVAACAVAAAAAAVANEVDDTPPTRTVTVARTTPTEADPLRRLLESRGVLAPESRGTRAGADVVMAALNFLDVQYRYGGDSAADGFDCSGFTRHVFATARGWSLPRLAEQQARIAGWHEVTVDALEPGDLVFFNTQHRTFSHVGIYVGDGRFIHAPRSGAIVRVESLRADYWRTRFDGARRADDAVSADPNSAS